MKNFLLFALSFSTFLLSSAQNNAIIPKWEKGNYKKVTLENISPRLENGEAIYDTIITKFIWEVVEIQDTSIIFSMLPLEMEIKSDDKDLHESSTFIIDLFQILKSNGIAINYKANSNGVLFSPNLSSSIYENYNDRYVQNDGLKNVIKNLLVSMLTPEEAPDLVHYDSIARFSLLSFIDPIVSNIHTPFGQKFTFNESVSTPDMTKEDWEVFLPSLDFEKSQKLFYGNFKFQQIDKKIECTFKFETEYLSPEENEENPTKKSKRKSSEDDFQFKFNYSGQYVFNAKNNYPIQYKLTNFTEIKKEKNNFTKLFQKTILFE